MQEKLTLEMCTSDIIDNVACVVKVGCDYCRYRYECVLMLGGLREKRLR